MLSLRRILGAPFRFAHRMNYGDISIYESDAAADANRVPSRPLTQAELGRTMEHTVNSAANELRAAPRPTHTGGRGGH